MRRSIFGYFCRRCFVSFVKLSFSGVVKLQKDHQAWCLGDIQAGYEPVQKDQLNSGMILSLFRLVSLTYFLADLLIFKTQADKKSFAKADAYEVYVYHCSPPYFFDTTP